MPLRHLMTLHAELAGSEDKGITGRIEGALSFAQQVVDSGALYFSRNPAVAERLKDIAKKEAKPLLEAYSPVKVTAYAMAAGSVLLLPAAMYELIHQAWSAISAPSWAALGFAAFISGGLAFSLWYQGIKRIGVTRTIVYHYLVPFVAVVFAAVFLDERISPLQVLGGLSILAGISLVQRSKIV